MEQAEAITVLVAVGARVHQCLEESEQKETLQNALASLAPNKTCKQPAQCVREKQCAGQCQASKDAARKRKLAGVTSL